MFRSLLVALASTAVIASVAAATPHSLGKGHWSLGYTASSEPNLQFGIGVADMTRIIVNVSVDNTNPGDIQSPSGDLEFDSVTEYAVGAAFHRYMSGMSSDQFSPFLGVGAQISDVGDVEIDFAGDQIQTNPDPSFEISGRFGAEAFVVEPLSIGGFIGVGFTKEGDFEFVEPGETQATKVEGDSRFGTVRSAITATLYWGGGASAQ